MVLYRRFSGISAFIQVQIELGITATVFELNHDVGGTWLTSTYPGCRCDVPSQLYSLGSELNPSNEGELFFFC